MLLCHHAGKIDTMFLIAQGKQLLGRLLHPNKNQPPDGSLEAGEAQHNGGLNKGEAQPQHGGVEGDTEAGKRHQKLSVLGPDPSAGGGRSILPSSRLVRQVAVMVGMSVSCLLDGTVIAYTAPAIPSLLHNSSAVQIDDLAVSWIGKPLKGQCHEIPYILFSCENISDMLKRAMSRDFTFIHSLSDYPCCVL